MIISVAVQCSLVSAACRCWNIWLGYLPGGQVALSPFSLSVLSDVLAFCVCRVPEQALNCEVGALAVV